MGRLDSGMTAAAIPRHQSRCSACGAGPVMTGTAQWGRAGLLGVQGACVSVPNPPAVSKFMHCRRISGPQLSARELPCAVRGGEPYPVQWHEILSGKSQLERGTRPGGAEKSYSTRSPSRGTRALRGRRQRVNYFKGCVSILRSRGWRTHHCSGEWLESPTLNDDGGGWRTHHRKDEWLESPTLMMDDKKYRMEASYRLTL